MAVVVVVVVVVIALAVVIVVVHGYFRLVSGLHECTNYNIIIS